MANTVSGSFPEVWSKYMAHNLDAASVMLPLVDRSVEADLSRYGDIVHVQKYGDVTINNYTEGSDMTIEDMSLTDDTLTLNQKKYFHFLIEETEKAQSHLDLVKGFKKRGMIAMGHAIDDRILTHTADVDSGNIIGTAALPKTLTQDNIYGYFVEARKMLRADNVLDNGFTDLVAVIDPDTEELLLNSPDLVKDTTKGDSIVEKATIGRVAGFRVVVSNRITATAGVKDLMFFHREFISFAMRINPKNVKTYEPELRFGTAAKVLGFYGSDVFNSTMGVILKKAA